MLHDFVRENELGYVFGAETGFRIGRNPDTVLAPDASFVCQERIQVIGIPKAYFPEAPALAVEIVSPSDTVEEVDGKMRRWVAAGIELAWVIHPGSRKETVYRSPTDVRVLTANDMLDGGNVVPGCECRVSELLAAIDG